MKKTKLVLISAWHVHTNWFMDALMGTGEVEISAVWDDDIERGEKTAQMYHSVFNPDLLSVLRSDSEAAIIECKTINHFDTIMAALDSGKHVFCDKPLTLSSSELNIIRNKAAALNLKLMVSFESLSLGVYTYMLKVIKEEKIGRITSAYFRRSHRSVTHKDELPAYWFDTSQTGGGVTLDLGCHGLSIIPLICGKPTQIFSAMTSPYWTNSDEISTTVMVFENGAIGTAHTSYTTNRLDNLLEVTGTKGSIIIVGDPDKEKPHVFLQSDLIEDYRNRQLVPDEQLPSDKPLPILQFIQLINGPEKSIQGLDIDSAAIVTRIIECAYQSCKEKRAVIF